MRNTFALIIASAFCAAELSPAADWSSRFQYDTAGDKFSSQEVTLDLFGLHASRDRDNYGGSTLGVGAGVNYFFTKNFGLGAETYLDEVHLPRHVDANFYARYPMEDLSLAPYAVVGLGRQFHDVAQWTAHIGAGVEFRLNRDMGVFADLRHVFTDHSKDMAVWRFGVRMGF